MTAPVPEAGSPFLTVVVPLGPIGEPALRETLLSLVGQDDDDFEAVLVAGPGTVARAVDDVVADQPPRLASRLRVVEAAGTTPGALRNAGLAAARGDYVAVLPEGDLALGRWVRTFHTATAGAERRIVRAVGVTQDHTLVEVAGHRSVRATGTPSAGSPAEFSLWQHALEPASPAGSWAWPRALAAEHGLQYDDEVADDADRELLVRAAQLVEVADLGVVTLLSRRWDPASVPAGSTPAGPTAEEVIDGRALRIPPGESRRIRAALAAVVPDTSADDELARMAEELRLTHDHAANLEAVVRSLEGQVEAMEARHAKDLARVRRKLEAKGSDPAASPASPAEAPPGRSWRGRRRGQDPAG